MENEKFIHNKISINFYNEMTPNVLAPYLCEIAYLMCIIMRKRMMCNFDDSTALNPLSAQVRIKSQIASKKLRNHTKSIIEIIRIDSFHFRQFPIR